MSYLYAEKTHQRPYYLGAAVYSFAFLFPETAQPARRGSDAGGGGGGPRAGQSLSPSRRRRPARRGDRADRCRARYAGGATHEAADDGGAAPRYAATPAGTAAAARHAGSV